MGRSRKGSVVGNLSTSDKEYKVVVEESDIDHKAVQLVMIWFSSCVKDDFNVEAAGSRVGKDGGTSDRKALESSWECERERACCASHSGHFLDSALR
jgi:hypothetical protein